MAAMIDEIVVVDDGSTDGSCDNLPHDVKIVRNELPTGVARARNIGAFNSTGDVIVFCDGHIRVPNTFRNFAKEAINGDFLCASCCKLYPEKKNNKFEHMAFYGASINFYPNNFYKIIHNTKKPRSRLSSITCPLGACYAMSRELYNKLPWINKVSWGYDEQAMAMKCFLCDVDMLVDRDCMIRHKFKKEFNYHVGGLDRLDILLHVYKVILENDTYYDWFVPIIKEKYARWFDEYFNKIEEDVDIKRESIEFKKIKIRSDKELLKWIGAHEYTTNK